MRFLADECCDAALVAGLRADGHDVLFVLESCRGEDDETVLRLAFDQGRVLLTEDKDFGELVFRLAMPAHGIVLLRMETMDSQSKWNRLRQVLHSHANRLEGSFTVIDRQKARIRPLRTSP